MRQDTALGILKTGRNVYLTGAAGAGKTHVLRRYIEYLRAHHANVAVTASTGIAATHLQGMTIHSWSGIGVRDYLSDYDLDALSQKQQLVRRISRTDVLIIDEISMLAPTMLDMVDAVCRELKRDTRAFGGLQVIFAGDFFQLPPVVRGQKTTVDFAYAAESWQRADIRTCYLTEQHRHQKDPLLAILHDIRDGALTQRSRDLLVQRQGAELKENEYAVVLHTHNENVDAHNAKELKKIDASTATYTMESNGRSAMIAGLKRSVLAPEILELKVGARIMFVKNDPERRYANGTLGTITDVSGVYPEVATHDGRRIIAEPVSWEVVEDGKVRASVTQVPLRLAWAITVHKSQGMTLDAVAIDLSRAFVPGQGYVALSRARTLDGLVLHGLNETALTMNESVCELDVQLREESKKWTRVFESFSDQKVAELHADFLAHVSHGEDSKEKERATPTHLQTAALLDECHTLLELATARGMTIGTILTHLEKLKKEGQSEVFVKLQPDDETLKDVQAAQKKMADTKLAPLHRALKGAYTYEELRLARLFLE